MRTLILLLCLVSSGAWATDWHVCQTGLGTTDGTSAANCYNGFQDAWGVAGDIDAGDTLYVVGDITGIYHQVGDNGTAGNPITIDCQPPGQASRGVMISTSASNPAFYADDKQYITIKNCEFRGNPSNLTQTSVLRFVVRTATRTGITIQNVKASNEYATSAAVHPCVSMDNSAEFRYVDTLIENSEFYNCGIGIPTQNSDGITINANSSGLIVRDNIFHGNATDGADIAGGLARFERNVMYGNLFDGAKIHCGSTAIPAGAVIASNISYGNAVYAMILVDLPSAKIINNLFVARANTLTSYQGVTNALNAVYTDNPNSGTCTYGANTWSNNYFEAAASTAESPWHFEISTKAAIEATDTINGNSYYAASGDPLIFFEADVGNNLTSATLAAWQATHTKDISSEGGFVGGSAPTTAAGFSLTSGSALRRTGKDLNIGNYQDAGNRAFLHPPSIGAWEATSGDARVNKTAR